jgi:hypothetical protein
MRVSVGQDCFETISEFSKFVTNCNGAKSREYTQKPSSRAKKCDGAEDSHTSVDLLSGEAEAIPKR